MGPIVKRVIASEGDVVDIDAAGNVSVNGVLLDESSYAMPVHSMKGNLSYPVTVPEGCVMLLGDNRPISSDSRYDYVGFAPVDSLLGKAQLRLSGEWNIYENFISQAYNLDYRNFGFAGAAKGEKTMAEFLAGLEMCAFVCDYDHNAPSVDHLRATHEPLYRAIRAAHPDIPYVMMTRPDFDGDRANSAARRDVVYETYRRALSEGDRNVYFIDGERLLSGPYLDMATVDGCHPTDLGFYKMALALEPILRNFLKKASN